MDNFMGNFVYMKFNSQPLNLATELVVYLIKLTIPIIYLGAVIVISGFKAYSVWASSISLKIGSSFHTVLHKCLPGEVKLIKVMIRSSLV